MKDCYAFKRNDKTSNVHGSHWPSCRNIMSLMLVCLLGIQTTFAENTNAFSNLNFAMEADSSQPSSQDGGDINAGKECVASIRYEQYDSVGGFIEESYSNIEGDAVVAGNLIIRDENNNVLFENSDIDTIPSFDMQVGKSISYEYSILTESGCIDTMRHIEECYQCNNNGGTEDCYAGVEYVSAEDGPGGFIDASTLYLNGDFIVTSNMLITSVTGSVLFDSPDMSYVPDFEDMYGETVVYTYTISTEQGCTDTMEHIEECYRCNNTGGHYESCSAGFSFDFDRDNGMIMHLYNHSHSNTDFTSNWTFVTVPDAHDVSGAEITLQDREPSIEFTDTGFVNLTLAIMSIDSSCSDTVHFDQIYVPGETFDSHGECQFGANIEAEPDTNVQRAGHFSINSSGVVASIRWDFNDGSAIVESLEAYHEFPHDGYFNVCAFVTDTAGCEIETCMPINIGEGEGSSNCFADFYFEQDSTYGFTFVNTSQGDYSNSELWVDGPNGGQYYSNAEEVSHVFTAPGYWNVCMNVWNDTTGCQSNNCMTVAVEDTSSDAVTCYADYSYSLDLETNTVTFNNKSQGNNIEYHWEFGDGGISDEENPIHTYADKGFYHVGLSVIIKDEQGNPQCHSHYENLVKLVDENTSACFADFGFWTDGLTLHVNDNSQGNISSYYYNFAGLGDADSAMASFTFPENGFYEVCLTVIDKDEDGNINCQADVCHGIQIGEGGCFAEFTSFADSLTVSFTNESEGEYNQVFWHFDDQGSSNENNPTVTFDEPGFYHVCMTIADSIGGCHSDVCRAIQVGEVSEGGACYADFNFFIEDTLMAFNNQSQGSYNESFWTFIDHNNGEQFTSYDQNPVLGVPGPGFYEACLTIIDKDEEGNLICQSDHCKPIDIKDENGQSAGCFPEFSFFIDSLTISFNNESNGAFNKVYWSFADQGSSEEMNPIFTFNEYGFYEVCLFIADENIDPNQPGCHGMEKCHYIELIPPGELDSTQSFCFADFSYFIETDSNGINSVQFNNESKGNFTNVFWVFEDPNGEDGTSSDFSPRDDTVPNGFYHVCLTVFDSISGCQADYCEGIQVGDVAGTGQCFPEFSFRIEDRPMEDEMGNMFHEKAVIFNNESQGDYSEQWWEFSGFGGADEENPEFIFPGPGFYEVCLFIGGGNGCHGEVCHPIQIFGDDGAATGCFADFNFFIEEDSVRFNNTSKGAYTDMYPIHGPSKWNTYYIYG